MDLERQVQMETETNQEQMEDLTAEGSLQGGKKQQGDGRFRQQFWKTELCSFFEAKGRCTKGDRCEFAHGRAQLTKAPDLRKTSLCKMWLNFSCKKQANECQFAHGWHDLRVTETFTHKPKSKSPPSEDGSGDSTSESQDSTCASWTDAAVPSQASGSSCRLDLARCIGAQAQSPQPYLGSQVMQTPMVSSANLVAFKDEQLPQATFGPCGSNVPVQQVSMIMMNNHPSAVCFPWQLPPCSSAVQVPLPQLVVEAPPAVVHQSVVLPPMFSSLPSDGEALAKMLRDAMPDCYDD